MKIQLTIQVPNYLWEGLERRCRIESDGDYGVEDVLLEKITRVLKFELELADRFEVSLDLPAK